VGARGFLRECGRCADASRKKFDGVGALTPGDVTPQQGLGVVVRETGARPRRLDENVFTLTFEALADAWPCKR
jgi:Rap1a immunity proteins